jgi:hypothetical protein
MKLPGLLRIWFRFIYLEGTISLMNEFQRQFEEVQDYLRFGDYGLVIKRIIDFTLDT